MKKELLSGNEAIARGAYEANVRVATGYPGTPSSEIVENITDRYPEIQSEWSVNEKVALEVAIGASFAGVRTLTTMKHVGLNVAADPLMTLTYTGVNGGMVIVVADDPGMHSSQNEQDTRNYGRFARVPVFEPSDSEDARQMVHIGLEVSEKFDTPSILRPITRVSHTRTVTNLEDAKRPAAQYTFQKNPAKYVMMPGNAIPRHGVVEDRWQKLKEYSESFPLHREDIRGSEIGIVTHGLSGCYVREAMPEASVFQVAMYPVPVERIKAFASKVKKLYVVEELDPIIEQELRFCGVEIAGGKGMIPICGELSPDVIRKAFGRPVPASATAGMKLPPRPPVLCKGCGHIPVFEVLRDMGATVLGDIGCYTLGALPPYRSIDTTVCMGASVGNEVGFKRAGKEAGIRPNSVAVIGDSTFFHSGMTNLVNAVYNQVPITLIILDNRITAMTGHQPNVETGMNNHFKPAGEVNLEALVRALGVKRVTKANAYKKEELRKLIETEMAADEVSVILVDEICVIGEARIKKALEANKAH